MKKVIYLLNIVYVFWFLFKLKLIGSKNKNIVKGNNIGILWNFKYVEWKMFIVW